MKHIEAKRIILKTKRDYNTIAKYFSQTREYAWPEFKYFKRFIKDGQNILDWGCGNGRMILCLKGKRVKYYGVDQSSELLKIARQKFASQIKAGRVKFYSVSTRPKKFKANYFDLVFSVASLFHLPDEESRLKVLNQFYKEMKKGAKLVVLVWNLKSDWAKTKVEKGWKKLGQDDFLIPWKNPQGQVLCERYYHHFTPEELKDLLKRVGFKVKKLEFMSVGTWSDSKGGRNLIAVAEK